MELALIWFISFVALSEEQKAQNAAINLRIDEVEERVYDVERRNISLAGAISSQRALQQVNHSNQEKAISNLNQRLDATRDKVDFLDNKMIELHN